MAKRMIARILPRYDTAANLEAKNPVLLDHELIIVKTTSGEKRFKIGDGTKTYKQLPFQDEVLRGLIPSIRLKTWSSTDV